MQVIKIIKRKPLLTIADIEEILNLSQFESHYTTWTCYKLPIWVPHHFTEKHLNDRKVIYKSLFARNETESFLDRLVTGDEK